MDLIEILNPNTRDFKIRFDGVEIPELAKSIAAGSITVSPEVGMSTVTMELIARKIVVEREDNTKLVNVSQGERGASTLPTER